MTTLTNPVSRRTALVGLGAGALALTALAHQGMAVSMRNCGHNAIHLFGSAP